MRLSTPESVQRLQAALHAKAKGAPRYRFYALYDKVHRPDVLARAYACCRANRGGAGVDGQTFEGIEAYGVERWLGELAARPPVSQKVAELNRLLEGWANDFCLGSVSRVYRAVDEQARRRRRQWVRAKYPHHGYGRPSYPAPYLHEVLGWVRLQGRPRTFPCARA